VSDKIFKKGVVVSMKPIIFCDFDGTITLQDTTDAILEAFADPAWQKVEERWVAGSIGSRECLREQMSLVRATEEELGRLVDSIPVDPYFLEFARDCTDLGFPFHVVSDGFDWVIHRTFQRPEMNGNGAVKKFKMSASSLQIWGSYMITTFPHGSVHCTHGCATCKPILMEREAKGSSPVVFIGDGNSDRFAAAYADIVFARKSMPLMKYCEEQNIPCIPYESFADVRPELNQFLAGMAAQLPATTNPLVLSYKTE
jgi:2,3-diketo-5-methylthio-1-phosphopentane phosphatase